MKPAYPRAAAGKTDTPQPRPLTPNQQKFVDEYLVDLSATQAAIRAGYSAKTAGAIGHRLLKKVEIDAAISAAKAARSAKTAIDAEWVLRRLAGEATADLADLYDANGNLKSIHDWPMVWRTGLVVGMETVSERTGSGEEAEYSTVRKVKLQDRIKQVELIGKHVDVRAFRDQVGVSAPDGGPVQVQAVPLPTIAKALERVRARSKG